MATVDATGDPPAYEHPLMIAPGTTFEGPVRVSLDRIVFTQLERRNPRRVQFYFKLLTQFPAHDPGLVMLTPLPGAGGGQQQQGFYTLLDGHHRTIAALLAGRRDVLALIQYAPPEPPAAAPEEEERAPEPDAAPQEPQEGDEGVCTLDEFFEMVTQPKKYHL